MLCCLASLFTSVMCDSPASDRAQCKATVDMHAIFFFSDFFFNAVASRRGRLPIALPFIVKGHSRPFSFSLTLDCAPSSPSTNFKLDLLSVSQIGFLCFSFFGKIAGLLKATHGRARETLFNPSKVGRARVRWSANSAPIWFLSPVLHFLEKINLQYWSWFGYLVFNIYCCLNVYMFAVQKPLALAIRKVYFFHQTSLHFLYISNPACWSSLRPLAYFFFSSLVCSLAKALISSSPWLAGWPDKALKIFFRCDGEWERAM